MGQRGSLKRGPKLSSHPERIKGVVPFTSWFKRHVCAVQKDRLKDGRRSLAYFLSFFGNALFGCKEHVAVFVCFDYEYHSCSELCGCANELADPDCWFVVCCGLIQSLGAKGNPGCTPSWSGRMCCMPKDVPFSGKPCELVCEDNSVEGDFPALDSLQLAKA